jgi:hypothetical protein
LKHGWENIFHEIVAENLTKDEAENMEVYLIKVLESNNNKHGYNIESGGNVNKTMSEETREKLSLSQPKFFGGRNNYAKKVICLNNLMIFDSIADANEWIGFKRRCALIACFCSGTIDVLSVGKHPITEERLVWDYYTEGKKYKKTVAKK